MFGMTDEEIRAGKRRFSAKKRTCESFAKLKEFLKGQPYYYRQGYSSDIITEITGIAHIDTSIYNLKDLVVVKEESEGSNEPVVYSNHSSQCIVGRRWEKTYYIDYFLYRKEEELRFVKTKKDAREVLESVVGSKFPFLYCDSVKEDNWDELETSKIETTREPEIANLFNVLFPTSARSEKKICSIQEL
jgi:hypothetical protein